MRSRPASTIFCRCVARMGLSSAERAVISSPPVWMFRPWDVCRTLVFSANGLIHRQKFFTTWYSAMILFARLGLKFRLGFPEQ